MIARFKGNDYVPFTPISPLPVLRINNQTQNLFVVSVYRDHMWIVFTQTKRTKNNDHDTTRTIISYSG